LWSGGRPYPHDIFSPELNVYINVGGACIGPTQDYILRAAKEVGVEMYEDVYIYTKGGVMYDNTDTGEIKAVSIDIPPFSSFAPLDFNALLVKIESLVDAINVQKSHHFCHTWAPWIRLQFKSGASRIRDLLKYATCSLEFWILSYPKTQKKPEDYTFSGMRVVETVLSCS
jgi:hypothetical protein